MPTIFTHAVCAAAIGSVYATPRMPSRFWALTVICSMLPDADVIGLFFGIRYGEMLGHRGLTHSLLFALLVGWIATAIVLTDGVEQKSKRSMWLYFFLVTVSHPLLDALTNGGLGIALLSPFDTTRYFFPVTPIEVSPIGRRFFSAEGLTVLASEIKWVWLPSLFVALAAWLYRRLTMNRRDT